MTKPKKQVERYNMAARKRLPSPENVERFLDEYENLCIAHGLAFGHEDTQGAFVIEDCDKGGLAWARAAQDNSTPRDEPEIERLRVAENKIARIEAQCLRAIEDGGNDSAIEEIARILGIPVFRNDDTD